MDSPARESHLPTDRAGDRPDRIVGAVPTEDCLDGLGFAPANPPNAALVSEFLAGQGVVVLELIEPTYDPDTGTLTYAAEVLEGYEGENLTPELADQVAARLPAEFCPAALFIGDCSNYTTCYCEIWAMIDGQAFLVQRDQLGPIPGALQGVLQHGHQDLRAVRYHAGGAGTDLRRQVLRHL
jgi:hypothetical protein